MNTAFALPLGERRRLLAGDYRPVLLDTKPHGCDVGATYVLSWSRSSRTAVGEVTIEVPRAPLRYLTVTDIRRHRKGGWLIRFDVQDYRFPIKYLRRTPPVWDPNRDSAPVESSYTTSRWAALDELEVVPEKYQERLSADAYDRDRAMRTERVVAARTAGWRRDRERRKARDRLLAAA